jgi:acetolactate synthase I/II/III large subunit
MNKPLHIGRDVVDQSGKTKVSDYVAAFLADRGVRHAFGLTGGAIVHVFDSLLVQDGIEAIFTHHEQAAALAAVSYARCNGMGACVVTTGPGGTNALTGLLAAWQDSIPCIFISGNARRSHMSNGTPWRQIGTQEFDIVSLVDGMTNYATVVEEADSIGDILETAWQAATTGRCGPVWIDIPLDMQWAMVDGYVPATFTPALPVHPAIIAARDLEKVCDLLQTARRPLFLVGNGARLAGAEKTIRSMIENLDIPVICSWTGSDIFPSDHELYAGIPGISGQRGGNLAMQNCDLLIALGSHICFPITGGNFEAFAREATVVVVDIDPVELESYTVSIDVPVLADLTTFSQKLLQSINKPSLPDISPWREKCRRYAALNKVPQDRYDRTDHVDPYVFIAELTDRLDKQPIVIDGGGTALYAGFQASKTHDGQRLLCASAISAMGTGLPDSIGAAFALGEMVVCVIGDGSFQLNVQELQTIRTHDLPVKIIVINNQGYLAMRHTQDAFLGGRHAGSAKKGGLEMPSIAKITRAYDLEYLSVHVNENVEDTIDKLLIDDDATVCELFVDPDETSLFAQGFKEKPDGTMEALPLENMQPLLPREQFLSLMEIDEWQPPGKP